eukprot:TRINITY_DN21183_c0_g1_i1.p1 TRINITY_DN21183_c0_g1~~TRINITY_DN21183_c0_g1_i1.p1  ORF type:complete len:308 (-),score=76.08 TRINITY_DN21183_c0_g1_i1:151-1074(-)
MIRRPPRSTLSSSSAASDVYKRQVLMGAGIGSTFIGLLFVFKVTKYGLLLVSAGFIYQLFNKKEPKAEEGADQEALTDAWKARLHYSDCVFGLGLVFYGSEVMSSAFVFLRSDPAVLHFFASLDNGLLALVVGVVFTSIVQSSGASLGIFLSLANEGLLTPRAGIALTLGANVGTCLTAVLAAMGEGAGPMQVAVALIFVRTVAAVLFSLEPALLQSLVAPVCRMPTPAGVASCEIAAAHTAFNVLLALVVVPFADSYARLVKRLVQKFGYTSKDEMLRSSSTDVLEILVGGEDDSGEDSHEAKRKE